MKFKQGKVSEFAKGTDGKKNIYCFGAGRALSDFIDDFEEYHLEKDIKYIVDNSKEKQGTTIRCGNREIPVISSGKMLCSISSDDVLLITAGKYPEIIRQLKAFEELKNIDCYISYFLRMEQNDYDRDNVPIPEILFPECAMRIPKVIHYCWFGKSEIPRQNRIWMESWKKYCPDYEIIEWNENNFDVTKNLYIKQAYEKRKWAFVSDFARVDIIGEYGGVYLDTDVELIRNIDNFLRNEAFCGFERKRNVAFGLGFGAVKNHAIIERLRDDYREREFVLAGGKLNETASPVYQTELLLQYGLKRNGEFQRLDGITVYPQRVLCGMSPFSYKIMKDLSETYSIHHFSGSWLPDGEHELKKWLMLGVDELERI